MQKDESQISRQARWQRKHRAMGLCVLCSRPAFKGWRCKKHYEQHKITMRLRYIPKVRGRYKVSGSTTETATKRKAAKPAAKKTAAKKTATTRTATRTTAKKTAAKKTTARKTTARKTTARKAAPKRAAKG
ncbi:hypothetical protein K2Z84_31915 [Candidatus Binatia bacterium]|jgi:hypothetical protein|nr:hypothetical protein [Candidatus Binatia bacterium]